MTLHNGRSTVHIAAAVGVWRSLGAAVQCGESQRRRIMTRCTPQVSRPTSFCTLSHVPRSSPLRCTRKTSAISSLEILAGWAPSENTHLFRCSSVVAVATVNRHTTCEEVTDYTLHTVDSLYHTHTYDVNRHTFPNVSSRRNLSRIHLYSRLSPVGHTSCWPT